MRYLNQRDYNVKVRSEIKSIMMQNNDFTLEDAEDIAIEEVSGYLRFKYDVAKIFAGIDIYSSSQQYNEGDVVMDANNRIYVSLASSTSEPLSDSNFWALKDPRNKKLVSIVVDIALYLIFTSGGRNVPELREKRYDDAIAYLNKVQKEEIEPDLPLLDTISGSGRHRLGSNKKLRDKW